MGCGASVEQHDDAASCNEESVSTAQLPPTAIVLSMLSLENLLLNTFTGPYLCITSRSLRRVTKRFTNIQPDGSLTLSTDSIITFPVIGVAAKEIWRNTRVSVTVFARDSQGKDRPVASGEFTLLPTWLESADGFDGEMPLVSDLPSGKAQPPGRIGFHIAPSFMFPATAPGLDEMSSDFLIQQEETAAAIAEMTRKMRLDASSQIGHSDSPARRQSTVDSPSIMRRQPSSETSSGASTRRQSQLDMNYPPQSSRRSSNSLSGAQPLSSVEFDDLLAKVRAEKNATSREVVLVSFAGSSQASFSCAQLQQLVSTLRYDQEKAATAKLLCPRIRDPNAADSFIDLLADADKADIRKRIGDLIRTQ